MKKLLNRLLGRLRVWSAEYAYWWHREMRACPENELRSLYELAHKVHLFFYWCHLPWDPIKKNRAKIFGVSEIEWPS